jgi:PPOX class probable F420-dependent enzyme
MSDEQRRQFLTHGTRTAVLSVTRKDGRPHAAPIWFVLDGDDVLFTADGASVKAHALRRTGQAHLTVHDDVPPFSFVTIGGPVEISEDPDALLEWATRIAGRYMGADRADEYGRRNGVPGELLVRLRPERVVAFSAIAD